MRTKILYVENGKISLTKKELEDLLDQSYREGYSDGSNLYCTSSSQRSTAIPNPSNPWNDPFTWASSTCSNGIDAKIVDAASKITLNDISDSASAISVNNGTGVVNVFKDELKATL